MLSTQLFRQAPRKRWMDAGPKLHPISDEALALYRRCRFVYREFWPRACYKTREPPDDLLAFFDECATQGEQLFEDPERFEVIEDGWDHEHCDVCSLRIDPGDWFWPNEEKSIHHIELCETCHRRVIKLLVAEPGA